ncbi:hypothetical protein MMC16_000926 [Acarospora aff. strigata]|nr:hypothetical protein [Acarospora aff. strigata]
MDSTVWNNFIFRDDDIIIGTYAKSGTTWMQQIVSQLVFQGAEGLPVTDISPWMDMRLPPHEEKLRVVEAQTHRRFLKTHLPVDALVFSPQAKYIYILRDGRDVVWSFYNHTARASDLYYQVFNDSPGRVGPPLERPPASTRQYFLDWLDGNGYPMWPFWEQVRSWYAIRELPNVLLLHFTQLKDDLPGQMRRIADFLDIEVPEDRCPTLIEHCEFPYMKAHSANFAPMGGALWEGGAETFVHKGTNGRWRDELTAEDNAHYEAMAQQELGEDLARWLATGYP